MRRADRLLELVACLEEGECVTADALAARLEVAVRTIYRDIAALQAQGLPIDGQAGVGYLLRAPVRLPPLTFDHDEMDALTLGLGYASGVGDAALAAAAKSALTKIERIWPGARDTRRLRAVQQPERRAPDFTHNLRKAIRARRIVSFRYISADGARTRRSVRPLALTAFSEGWLLIAWCPRRGDFRNFRLDRMKALEPSALRFEDEPGKTLTDYLSLRATPAEKRG
ncbi:MAG: helix-turn-helix transcriptional regulator [Hyphomonadaceae bacterium]